MDIIQISWKDNADNETSFKIFKGNSNTTATDHIANVTNTGAAWTASSLQNGSGQDLAPNAQLTSTGNSTDSATVGETFIFTYEETTASGASGYFYAVKASNAVGDSDAVVTASGVVVT